MSIDKRIDNAALSATSIVQIFDNDTNNSSSIMQIPDINNSIQIHDIMLYLPFHVVVWISEKIGQEYELSDEDSSDV
nr:2197_t:CDS:2 [Entrophospora candida]